MKTTLTFSGPDDEYDLDNALNGTRMRMAIDAALARIRSRLKHESPSDEEVKTLEDVRALLVEGISRCEDY